MDKDNESALQKFLGENLDENQENPLNNDIFSGEETEPEVVVEKEEKVLPFNKDPKLQKYIDKEIERRLSEREPVVVEKEDKKPLVDEDYYIRLIGNDTPEKVAMIKESMARDEMILQAAEERAFNRLSQQEKDMLLADRAAEEELENAFDMIEDTFDVDITSNNPLAKKQRNEFLSFVEKIAPKDRNGEIAEFPDMVSAWETYQEMRQRTPSRAKDLASRSMGRSSEANATQIPKRITFEDAEDFIATLK